MPMVLKTIIDDMIGLNGVIRKAYIIGIITSQVATIIENATSADISLLSIISTVQALLKNNSNNAASDISNNTNN